MRRIRRKGQEEMVGFVIIIIIVAVIGVILLGISLRKPQSDIVRDSDFLDSFLNSVMGVTTSCETSFPGNFRSVRELVLSCNNGRECIDGKDSCEVLEEELESIMGSSWQVGSDRPFKAYELEVSLGRGDEILLEQGNKTFNSVSSLESLSDRNRVVLSIYF